MPNAVAASQALLFAPERYFLQDGPFRAQLLKWIGNKQRQADAIIRHFPRVFGTYFESFLGSGGVLGVLAPERAVASDIFSLLMEIWKLLHEDKEQLKKHYADRYALLEENGKERCYDRILASYNARLNGADLLFLCRACYGGVVRFRKNDGSMSTPVGIHGPISSESFAHRVDLWQTRTQGTSFVHVDFAEMMLLAKEGDLVHCDPPYLGSQTILYGAQSLSVHSLFDTIADCKQRGVHEC
jgi:DNA adenine methylase